MVITIHFQSEQDLQWLNKIVEMLKNAAIHFDINGVSPKKMPELQHRRRTFLNAVQSGKVITSNINIPEREERNAR